jgi:AraC-like DNA-binding protein
MSPTLTKSTYYFDNRPSPIGVTVTGVGYTAEVRRDKPWKRSLDCHAIVFIVRGRGSFESRSVPRRPISPGDLFFLFPGEWHFYNPAKSTAWEEYWMIFGGPTIQHLQQQKILAPEAPFYHNTETGRLVPLFRQALDLCRQGAHSSRERLPGLLLHIINEVLVIKPLAAKPQGQDPVAMIAEQVKGDPLKEWDFPRLAHDNHLSYALFRKRFRLMAGVPPYHFLLSERMKKAGYFIASGLNPHAVAYKIGMKDPYHFSRLFKKMTGLSPRNFQRFTSSR